MSRSCVPRLRSLLRMNGRSVGSRIVRVDIVVAVTCSIVDCRRIDVRLGWTKRLAFVILAIIIYNLPEADQEVDI
jgi:hypothetical protein